jgi:hypothetical protein
MSTKLHLHPSGQKSMSDLKPELELKSLGGRGLPRNAIELSSCGMPLFLHKIDLFFSSFVLRNV